MLRQIVSLQQSGGSDPEADKITVKVNVEDEPGKKFRIRPADTLSKLFDVFKRRANIQESDKARYFFGQKELWPTETLAEVGIPDGGRVVCKVQRDAPEQSTPAEGDDDEAMPPLEPLDDDVTPKTSSAKKDPKKSGATTAADDEDGSEM